MEDQTQGTLPVETLLAEKYRIKGVLGAGGMGVVYGGLNEWTGRPVALKVLRRDVSSPSALQRFFREARVSSLLDHPHIVKVIDLGRAEDGAWFIVQELLQGEALDAWLEGKGAIALRQTVEICVPIMSALVAAHRAGIVHRDLKPGNIFLAKRDRRVDPVLIDFGISKIIDASAPSASLTQEWIGTPAYMAPEQVMGERDLGPQADVYAMGAVLYRMLAGRPVFTGDALPVAVLTASSDAEPLEKWAPTLPESITRIVHRALARERSERTPDMSTLLAELLVSPSVHGSTWGLALRTRFQDSASLDLTLSDNAALDLDGESLAEILMMRAGATLEGPCDTAPVDEMQPQHQAHTLRGPHPARGEVTGPPRDGAYGQGRRAWTQWRRHVALGLLLLLVGLLVWWLRGGPDPATDRHADSGSWLALAVANAEAAVTFSAAATRWSTALLESQEASGAFQAIPHLPATGWSTAQVLAALVSSYRARVFANEAALRQGFVALDGFEREHGWGEYVQGRESAAAAWVILAASDLARVDPAFAMPYLSRGRDYLLAAQQADGGFADPPFTQGQPYQSGMALLALLAAQGVAPMASTEAIDVGLDWLRRRLALALADDGDDFLSTRGLSALLAVPLLLAAEQGLAAEADPALLAALVARMAADCGFGAEGCRRRVHDNAMRAIHSPNDTRSGLIAVVWFPWTLLAAHLAAAAPDLPPESRALAQRLQAWSARSLGAHLEPIAIGSGFILAEWTFVAARLAHAQPF